MENLPTVLLTENITGYLAYIDPQGSTVLIIFLLIFICFSFIASGAEVAFFSLSYKDINLLKTKKQHSYKRVVDLLEHPKELLASLLIANSFCNIAIIIIFNILLGDITTLSFWAEFALKVVSVTVLLVLFCEVMPKIFARNNNIRFAKDFGIVIEGIYLLFRRPGKFLVNYSDMIERRFSKNASASYRKEEIYDAIDITTPGDDENAAKEKDILKGIVKFSNTTVKQVMKSRLDVSGIEYDDTFEELMHKISELHYSRLPVYKEDLDAVT
ncbi:MAG TPA: CNNM domain-containing protein, partial [Chitinophagaceae bacterium]|nr:CNNM domain-containing protein [Chitinophagaceae bacterium]